MKTLITTLNSQYVHSNLAVKYLYSSVADDFRGVEIREFTINNEDYYVFGEIVKGDYDVVAFSCYIWNVEKIMYLAANLKKACPNIKIIMGGPEVSYDAVELIMANRFIDIIIQGEGEFAFREILQTMSAAFEGEKNLGEGLKNINGLIYRYEGKVYINQPAPSLTMDSIPFPYLYIAPEDDKIIYYESSRGCPRRCSYCLSSLERHVRALSMDRVRSDIKYFLIKKVKQVKFIDRTFNYDKGRAYEIIRYIMSNDNGITNFHFEMCADLMDQALFDLLKDARKGLFQFEIGVQSTNRDALEAVNRDTQVKTVIENIHKVVLLGNIEVHTDLIAGLPFEDYTSFASSFSNVYRTGADKIHLGFLKLLKGTSIRREADKYGYVYREKPPYEVISNQFISARDLVRLHQVESVLDLYYNRGGFTKALDYFINEVAASPFAFYEELADYYYLKGYQHANHRKEDLYRILLGFAVYKERTFGEGLSERVKSLLSEDMKASMNFDAVKKFEKKGWEL